MTDQGNCETFYIQEHGYNMFGNKQPFPAFYDRAAEAWSPDPENATAYETRDAAQADLEQARNDAVEPDNVSVVDRETVDNEQAEREAAGLVNPMLLPRSSWFKEAGAAMLRTVTGRAEHHKKEGRATKDTVQGLADAEASESYHSRLAEFSKECAASHGREVSRKGFDVER
jgi:hypothetical protein